MKAEPIQIAAYRAVKRAFDIVLSALCIVVLAVPCLILALFVARDTHASPIYTQRRMRKGGRSFTSLQFRTMVPDADDVAKYLDEDQLAQWRAHEEVSDDPRVTPLGRALRETGFDNVPQFLNVFAGQMSLVGPKPVTKEELETWYTPEEQEKLLSVPCGMNVIWQTRSFEGLHYADGSRQRHELAYAEKASIALDTRIIFGGSMGGEAQPA